MSKLSAIINTLYEQKQNVPVGRAYILLVTNRIMLNGLASEYGSINNMARAYGVSKFIYTINENVVKIYIPKENTSADTRQLVKDLDATIDEYYGIVQFDGTEPEARGEYVFDPAFQSGIGNQPIVQQTNKSDDTGSSNNPDDSEEKQDDKSSTSDEKSEREYHFIKIKRKEQEQDNSEKEENGKEDESEEDNEDDSELETDEVEDTDNDEDRENTEDEENEDSEDKIDNEDEDSGEEDIDDTTDEEDSEESDDSEIEGKTRADYFKNVVDDEDEDEGESGNEQPDGEDPDDVDGFFADNEVEANMDDDEKKSAEIEKDLSKELDKRIAKEKEEKKKAKKDKKSKENKIKFKKIKKKVEEATNVSSIPSSKLGTVDLLRSMATEPLVYDSNGFDDSRFNKSEINKKDKREIKRDKKELIKMLRLLKK